MQDMEQELCAVLLFTGEHLPYVDQQAVFFLGSAAVLTVLFIMSRIEIFELIPVVSVIMDWLEVLFSRWGVLPLLFLAVAALTAMGLFPFCPVPA